MPDRSELIVAGAVATGGVALGFALGALVHRLRLPPLIPADCSLVAEQSGTVAGVPYLERMRGGAQPDEAVPMVVVFHSRAASPSGHARMLEGIGRARMILPEGVFHHGDGKGRLWWELGVKAAVRDGNMAGAKAQWEEASERMAEFLRQIVRCRPTVGAPVLTGSSQGGEMTLLMASTHPELTSSGVAVSSYLLEPFWTDKMAPVRMIHGTGDKTVPYAWAKDYYEKVEAEGAPISFESYPSSGHSVTQEMARDWIASVKGQVGRLSATA